MLVLSRKTSETIVIGPDVTITVVSIGRGKVKLGVVAPAWITVDRGEVHEQKNRDRADPDYTRPEKSS